MKRMEIQADKVSPFYINLTIFHLHFNFCEPCT